MTTQPTINRFPPLKKPIGAPVIHAAKLLPEGDHITVGDLAKACGVSHDTIDREIKRGLLRTNRANAKKRGRDVPRSAAVVYLVRKGIIDPEATFHDVTNLVADWPQYMKNQLSTLLTQGKL